MGKFSVYRRYGTSGIIWNICMKVVSLFGFKGFQILKLMAVDLSNTDFVRYSLQDYKPRILTIKDFEDAIQSDPQKYTPDYLQSIKRRFSDSCYHCVGIINDDHLMSFGWICIGRYPLTKRKLRENAAFLFNDYTSPSDRGQGLHQVVINYRLQWLKEKGCDIAYSSVAMYNKASYKGFVKSGMRTKRIYAIWGEKDLSMTLRNIFK